MNRQPQFTLRNLQSTTVQVARDLPIGHVGDVTYVAETGFWYEWRSVVVADDGLNYIQNSATGLVLVRIDAAQFFVAAITTTPGTPIVLTHNFGTVLFVSVAYCTDLGIYQAITIDPVDANSVEVDSNVAHNYLVSLRKMI